MNPALRYWSYSIVWVLGLFVVLALGYYLGTLHGTDPLGVNSPIDDVVGNLVWWSYLNAPDPGPRVLLIEVFGVLLALSLIEYGGRGYYRSMTEYKKYVRSEIKKFD